MKVFILEQAVYNEGGYCFGGMETIGVFSSRDAAEHAKSLLRERKEREFEDNGERCLSVSFRLYYISIGGTVIAPSESDESEGREFKIREVEVVESLRGAFLLENEEYAKKDGEVVCN